jgi:hypothetical protein
LRKPKLIQRPARRLLCSVSPQDENRAIRPAAVSPEGKGAPVYVAVTLLIIVRAERGAQSQRVLVIGAPGKDRAALLVREVAIGKA